MRKKRIILTAVVCCLALVVTGGTKDEIWQRSQISLDGTWDFCTDSDRQGEALQWFSPATSLPSELPAGYSPLMPGKILVPGIWDAQGYGVATEKVRHNFVGCGWYRREIFIPDEWPQQNSTFLVLTGISRYAKVWIDGKQIGPEAIGCIGSHEWNVSPYVKRGVKSTLVICVDSKQRWEVDPLLGTAQLNDFVEVAWGGLWGHVYLESRPKVRLNDIYLRTSLGYSRAGDVTDTNCGVRATIEDEACGPLASGILTLELFSPEGKLTARASKPFRVALEQGRGEVELWAEVPNARLWTPDTPFLYYARVTLTLPDGTTDVLAHRYGMREILFAGSTILLNGKPLYLRGYGDDHIYPEQFSMSADINLYRQRLKAIKAFGFNHCRHHSIVMPHEYYDACDELGMLPSPEMLIAYPVQLPGTGSLWMSQVAPGTSPEAANNTIVERFRAVVHEFRNHPCIMVWVGGNEMGLKREEWDSMTLRTRCYEAAKSEDPDRPFMDCDGDWLKDYVAQGGRDTEDCYSILFDEWCNPLLNPDKYQTMRAFDKPTVAHEMGNYLTFSRPDEIKLFDRTNFFPFWMQQGWDDLGRLKLAEEVENWALASEQLYLMSYKYSIESARRNANLSGYHLWQINDYWTSSNGLFDHFFRPKSIKPEDFLPFNSSVVLLQRGLQFLYSVGDEISCSLQLSNYGPTSLKGKLSATLSIDGKKTDGREWESVGGACGKLTDLPSLLLSCPAVDRPTQAVVNVSLQTADSIYSNSWTTYIFPRRIGPATQWPVYADVDTRGYFPSGWNVRPIAELSGEYPARAVYAVARTTDKVRDAVSRGAGLIHFDASEFLSSIPMSYKQSWWKAGDTEKKNNTGTYVYENDIVNDVTDHNYCGPAWAVLLDGSKKFNLECGRERPEVVVRALSSIVRVRDAAVIFQFDYGKGKVIVDGLNHRGYAHYPLSQWLLARMVDRAASPDEMRVTWDKITEE